MIRVGLLISHIRALIMETESASEMSVCLNNLPAQNFVEFCHYESLKPLKYQYLVQNVIDQTKHDGPVLCCLLLSFVMLLVHSLYIC